MTVRCICLLCVGTDIDYWLLDLATLPRRTRDNPTTNKPAAQPKGELELATTFMYGGRSPAAKPEKSTGRKSASGVSNSTPIVASTQPKMTNALLTVVHPLK
jgi:hypothetical protein